MASIVETEDKIDPNELASAHEGKIRFVCMSDTHSAKHFPFDIPDGDVFVHAGDLTKYNQMSEYESSIEWIRKLPHKLKLVIAGNHDKVLDRDILSMTCDRDDVLAKFKEAGIIYLQHEPYQLPLALGGYKVFASPYAPEHLCGAFMPNGFVLESIWRKTPIPKDTDILITHTPPRDVLDKVRNGRHVGCEVLRHQIENVKPKVAIFGHIHEAYGHVFKDNILYINASTCNSGYRAKQKPIVFDL